MNEPFFRIAAASLKLKVADPSYNAEEILKVVKKAKAPVFQLRPAERGRSCTEKDTP